MLFNAFGGAILPRAEGQQKVMYLLHPTKIQSLGECNEILQ